MRPRMIARLDVKGRAVVKGVRMEGLRRVGVPADMARRYYEQGADELLYLDVVASLYGREPDLEAIDDALTGVFVPVTVGGGVRTLEHIRALLRVGADRVAINTAALATEWETCIDKGDVVSMQKRGKLLRDAAREFGASTLVLQVDAKRNATMLRYELFTHGGREQHDVDALEWIAEQSQHVSEVLLTSIDRDGVMQGADVALVNAASTVSSVPVIAAGGIQSPLEAAACIRNGAKAVAVGAALHAGARISDFRAALAEGVAA